MAGTQICIMTRLCGFTNFKVLENQLEAWLRAPRLVAQRVWCYWGCCFFVFNWEGCLFPGSLLFIANSDFFLCHCHFVRRFISQNAKPRKKQDLSNETKTAVLHADLRKKNPKIVRCTTDHETFIINAWHSCSPMSQAPRIHDFHQAHLARDHPGYRLVNSSQSLSFPRDPIIIFWEW